MSHVDEFEIGRIVYSLAGRDKGTRLVVVSRASEKNYIFVADGKRRKLANPKKKKIMHLKLTNEEKVVVTTDKQLRKVCNPYEFMEE